MDLEQKAIERIREGEDGMTEQEKKELLDELEKTYGRKIQRLPYQRRCRNHIKST